MLCLWSPLSHIRGSLNRSSRKEAQLRLPQSYFLSAEQNFSNTPEPVSRFRHRAVADSTLPLSDLISNAPLELVKMWARGRPPAPCDASVSMSDLCAPAGSGRSTPVFMSLN